MIYSTTVYSTQPACSDDQWSTEVDGDMLDHSAMLVKGHLRYIRCSLNKQIGISNNYLLPENES